MGMNFRPGYMLQGQPLGATRKQVMLSADGTDIDVSGVAYLELSSDNTTAANRTFTLTSSTLVGHELQLVFISGSSYTCQLQDSGNCKLSSAWEPTQYDSLSLMWNGSYWVETARSAATGTLDIPLADGHVLVGNSSGLAADVAMSGDITIANTGATAIGAGKVLLAMLGSGISPAAVVKYAGRHTTVGGSATEAITVTGVAATDNVFVEIRQVGATPRTIVSATTSTNTITVDFSGDPSTDHIIAYQVVRAAT